MIDTKKLRAAAEVFPVHQRDDWNADLIEDSLIDGWKSSDPTTLMHTAAYVAAACPAVILQILDRLDKLEAYWARFHAAENDNE